MLFTNDSTEKSTPALLSTRQVAEVLSVSERTIIRWRCDKINLDYMVIGQQARYEPEVVQSFKEAQTIRVSSSSPDPQQHDSAA